MNNLRKYILILTIVSFVPACEGFLEEEPRSQASPENFYATADHAEAAVVGAYNSLQRNGVYGTLQYFLTTDIVRNAVWNSQGGMGTYSFSAENVEVILPYWRDNFQGVNEANAAITHIPGIDMDEERKNTLIAEARFLRALQYFNLVRYFGDVPWFATETNSLDRLSVARDPASLVYENIIDDLEFGMEHLDTKSEAVPGRATRGAATALLAKVYLTRASITERDGGDGTVDFQAAADLAEQVMLSNEYDLVDYYPDVFIPENKNHDEIIFDVQFTSGGVDEGAWIGAHMGLQGPPNLGGSWGNIHATEYFHTIYEDDDMVRQEWTTPHVRVIGDGTLRMDYPEMHFERWKIGKFRRYPIRQGTPFVLGDWNVHWPVLRYAEVLLIFAEATLEANDAPSDEIFDALNQLRFRARNRNGDGTRETLHADILPRNLTYYPALLPDISSADYPDYASLQDYIRNERARELGGEAVRWFDLTRWGTLVENITFLLTHIPEGRTRPEGDSYDVTANNVREHHILLPIPSAEMQANPLMVQNDGY